MSHSKTASPKQYPLISLLNMTSLATPKISHQMTTSSKQYPLMISLLNMASLMTPKISHLMTAPPKQHKPRISHLKMTPPERDYSKKTNQKRRKKMKIPYLSDTLLKVLGERLSNGVM